MTDLERFKQDYKPREGFSFILYQEVGEPMLTGSVFKKQIIFDKKANTQDEAHLSILNVADTYSNFVKILFPYIERR